MSDKIKGIILILVWLIVFAFMISFGYRPGDLNVDLYINEPGFTIGVPAFHSKNKLR